MATHFNISGELTQELLAAGSNVGVNKISLTNTQKVSKCKVDLYIEKKLTGKFYLLKGVELPIGASTTVTGVGTSFLSEVSIGDEIVVSSETRTVSSIASDTSLTVSVATTDNANDTTPDCNPTALVDVIIN